MRFSQQELTSPETIKPPLGILSVWYRKFEESGSIQDDSSSKATSVIGCRPKNEECASTVLNRFAKWLSALLSKEWSALRSYENARFQSQKFNSDSSLPNTFKALSRIAPTLLLVCIFFWLAAVLFKKHSRSIRLARVRTTRAMIFFISSWRERLVSSEPR